MALPLHLQGNLMPLEINFLAENDVITILPRYSMKSIELIGVSKKKRRKMGRGWGGGGMEGAWEEWKEDEQERG